MTAHDRSLSYFFSCLCVCSLRLELESILALECKAELESLSQVSSDYLTSTYVLDKKEHMEREWRVQHRLEQQQWQQQQAEAALAAPTAAAAAAAAPAAAAADMEAVFDDPFEESA